jgi:hypothetical protein
MFIGRRLPELLRSAGLMEVQCKVHVDTVEHDAERRMHLLALIDALHDTVLALGLMTNDELVGHRKALMRHLEDPNTMVIDQLLVQAWGRKPN